MCQQVSSQSLQQKGMHHRHLHRLLKNKKSHSFTFCKNGLWREEDVTFLIITSCQCGCDPSFVACFIHPFRDEQRWHMFTRRDWGTECVKSDVDVVAPAGSGEGGQSRQGAAILSSEQKRCYLLYAGDEILPSFIRIMYMIVYIYVYIKENHRVTEFNLLSLGWFFPISKQRIPKGCWVGAIKKTWAPLMFYFLP